MKISVCAGDNSPIREARSLKVWKSYYALLDSGAKTFEIRCFPKDEEPGIGEVLVLDEYDEANNLHTGQSLAFEVTYLLKLANSDESFCLPFPKTGLPVWCLGIKRI